MWPSVPHTHTGVHLPLLLEQLLPGGGNSPKQRKGQRLGKGTGQRETSSSVYLVAVATAALSLGNPKGRAGSKGGKAVLPWLPLSLIRKPAFISKSSDKENARLERWGVVFSGQELKREGCLPGQKLALGSKGPAPISSQ